MPGRPKGLWFKWKRDPNVVDADPDVRAARPRQAIVVLFRLHSACWKGNEIVPIGKAYFGFTDEELKQLDKWVRNNTVASFGPVREVRKELVFEVAFDSAQQSTRHKSGVALRFPRINRIRWDKPASEAATLDDMQIFLGATLMSRQSIQKKIEELDPPDGEAAAARGLRDGGAASQRDRDAQGPVAVRKPPPGADGPRHATCRSRSRPRTGGRPKKPDPMTNELQAARKR